MGIQKEEKPEEAEIEPTISPWGLKRLKSTITQRWAQ